MQHARSVDRRSDAGHHRIPAGVIVTVWVVFVLAGAMVPGARADEPRFEILERSMVDEVEQAYVRYPSGDLMVTGWLFVNPFSTVDVEPCLVFNHGGVDGVTETTRAKARWLAKQGYVVFAPSYRGEDDSEGEIEVAMGEVDDVLAAIEELAKHPGVQADRFVLVGTSHGALVSVKAAARAEACGRVRAVVTAYGVMDIYAWYQHLLDNDFDVSDPLSRRIYGDGPQDRPEAFAARHALNVLDTLCPAPVMVVQGARDAIVPAPQAHTLGAALAARGRADDRVEVYEHGEHGFLFWDDPQRRSAEQLADTERAWSDILAFLRAALGEETWTSE